MIDDIRVHVQQFFQHGPGAVELGIKKPRKFVVDLDLQPSAFSPDQHDVV